MTNAMTVFGQDADRQISTKVSEEDFAKATEGGFNFLPRLQLFQGSSNEVKRKEIGLGEWGVIKGKKIDIKLGESFIFVPCAYRLKAMEFGAKVLSYFDPKTDNFQRIKDESKKKDSKCACGPEFLIWLPEQLLFCTLYCTNTTFKNAAPTVRGMLNKLVAADVEFIEGAEHSWHGPKFNISSQTEFAMPSLEMLVTTKTEFIDAKDSEVELADDGDSSDGGGEQRAR